jgi:energy-converting hydrogenase Eha subunit G
MAVLLQKHRIVGSMYSVKTVSGMWARLISALDSSFQVEETDLFLILRDESNDGVLLILFS